MPLERHVHGEAAVRDPASPGKKRDHRDTSPHLFILMSKGDAEGEARQSPVPVLCPDRRPGAEDRQLEEGATEQGLRW
jgi:hypothetical protein